MEEHIVKLLHSEYITHDVKRFIIEKPPGYQFQSGQATKISINKPEWRSEKRPFSFTSLNHWKDLEFTIKIYQEHKGVTRELEKLQPGDELILHDIFGAITYKGKGVFIAGGAGVTPFISILRQCQEDRQLNENTLIFSNKTSADIILKKEFEDMLGNKFYSVLTREHVIGFLSKHIDDEYLKNVVKDFGQHFYICGPKGFIKSINDILLNLGAKSEALVFEDERLINL